MAAQVPRGAKKKRKKKNGGGESKKGDVQDEYAPEGKKKHFLLLAVA